MVMEKFQRFIFLNVRSEMMKRLLTILISIILFSTIFTWLSYTPASQRESNVNYFSFLETFTFVSRYVGLFYLLVGLPLSFFIDKLIEKIKSNSKLIKYFAGLGLYSLAGLLVCLSFLILSIQNIDSIKIIPFLMMGFIASNLYYHFSLLISKVNIYSSNNDQH